MQLLIKTPHSVKLVIMQFDLERLLGVLNDERSVQQIVLLRTHCVYIFTVNYWTRAYGLSPPSTLIELITGAASRK